ncbi:MAG: ATP-binding protein [Gammaproteobacteria bacterium]
MTDSVMPPDHSAALEAARESAFTTAAGMLAEPVIAEVRNRQQPTDITISYRRVSDIEAKPIRWLWPGRIARGKVTMLAGHPGLGKSQVTVSMAAVVSTGGLWPVDRSQCEQGSVIILSAEDDAADTIRPRLEAAGADLDRCYVVTAVRERKKDDALVTRSFNLAADIELLRRMAGMLGDVALIDIDPITAYLGGIDSHKNADVRV